MSIRNFQMEHYKCFTEELRSIKKLAKYSKDKRGLTSRHVKRFNLPSCILNQVIRKYSRNPKIKKVRSVKMTVPGQSIRVDRINRIIYVPCLDLVIPFFFPNDFIKVNQIEIGKKYMYVTVSYADNDQIETEGSLGVDLNSSKHTVVCASSDGSLVRKMGRSTPHIRKTYVNRRRKLQRKNSKSLLRKLKLRERNKINDILHKISKEIVRIAFERKLCINLEKLTGIRKSAKCRKSQRHNLNSWPFYKLKMLIEYKARKLGVPVLFVNPRYTSKACCRCWRIGTATTEEFKCKQADCLYVVHRDVNAARNISHISSNNCMQTRMYAKARQRAYTAICQLYEKGISHNYSLSYIEH